MKKILTTLALISILAVLVVPLIASAQTGPQQCCKLRRTITIDTNTCNAGDIMGPLGIDTCNIGGTSQSVACKADIWGLFCTINTIGTVVDWIFVVLVAVAVLFVILGAMHILIAGGDPEKVNTGRNYIMWAVIGLVIAFLARAVPAIVATALA